MLYIGKKPVFKYLLVFTTIFLITMCILNNNAYSDNELIKSNAEEHSYIIEKKWSLPINITKYNALFRSGDFNRDGFEEIIIVFNNKLIFINGCNGTVFREIEFDKTIVGFKPIRDLNNDGFNEVVIVTGSYTAVEATREFIVWDLVENRALRKNSITIEIGYYSLEFDYYRLIAYRDDVVEYLFPYVSIEQGLVKVTYVIYYNIVNNDIGYRVIENKGYLLYSNLLTGDIDNDGVVEFTNKYLIEQYSEGDLATSRFRLYIRDFENRTIFSHVSKTLFLYIELSNTTQRNVFLMESIENRTIGDLTLFIHRITAVSDRGDILYEKPYLNATGRKTPMGSIFTFIYLNENSSEVFIELLNTNDGSLIARSRLGRASLIEFAETVFSTTSLGDIDSDGVKEFFLKYRNECFIYKANENLTKYVLRNCSLDNIVLSYKTVNGVYLVTVMNTTSGLELEAFNIYKPGVSPAISSIPLPFEPLPLRVRGFGLEHLFIVAVSTIVVAIGIYIIIRSIKKTKRVRK